MEPVKPGCDRRATAWVKLHGSCTRESVRQLDRPVDWAEAGTGSPRSQVASNGMNGRFEPGTHLQVQRPRLYYHHGIYVSDDRVIQFGSGVSLVNKRGVGISASPSTPVGMLMSLPHRRCRIAAIVQRKPTMTVLQRPSAPGGSCRNECPPRAYRNRRGKLPTQLTLVAACECARPGSMEDVHPSAVMNKHTALLNVPIGHTGTAERPMSERSPNNCGKMRELGKAGVTALHESGVVSGR